MKQRCVLKLVSRSFSQNLYHFVLKWRMNLIYFVHGECGIRDRINPIPVYSLRSEWGWPYVCAPIQMTQLGRSFVQSSHRHVPRVMGQAVSAECGVAERMKEASYSKQLLISMPARSTAQQMGWVTMDLAGGRRSLHQTEDVDFWSLSSWVTVFADFLRVDATEM